MKFFRKKVKNEIRVKMVLIPLFFSLLIFLSTVAFPYDQGYDARPLRINEKIQIDGQLKEESWHQAEKIDAFLQFQPKKGQPATFPTFVFILYDQKNIYFGFECYDDEPSKIAAHLTKRDADLKEDDAVAIFIDTFHDHRNCYYFMTNLLGTQLDGRVVENGLINDNTWDGTWQSAASRTEFGWTAEIAIDLSSLKYKSGEGLTWGFNVGRSIPRLLELDFWAGPLESPYKVSQYGDLIGLNLEATEKNYHFVPHIIGKAEEGKPSGVELGLDVRYAFSQAISANLTLNPDFATVEADQEQINLTRFELNLPEKRNFFLEGSEIYRQRIPLFYSRRIGDINGGFKLYGKSAGYEFSSLAVLTKKNASDSGAEANFTVLRLKKDIFKSSTLGFQIANKHCQGENRGDLGLDVSLYFTDTLKFTGQLAKSYGEFNQDTLAFFLRPSYDSATSHFHVRYTYLGRYFGDNANAVGFIRDDNRRELDSALSKTFWIKKRIIERIAYDSNYNIYWGVDGVLRSWQIDQTLETDLANKFSFSLDYTSEYKLYEKKFWNNETNFIIGYNTREWQSAQLCYGFGQNFDRDFQLIKGNLNHKFGESLSLEYSLTRLKFSPDPQKDSTWINVIRVNYYLTKDLFFKLFYQTNSAIDKKNLQLLFVYRFQPPFGLIQLAYQKGTARLGEKGTQGHTFFLKIAYII